jgi:hypothetical protein
MAMVVIFIVCLLGVPVLVLARENPDAYFFVFSGIVFTICMSVLCLIFVPKVYFYRVACNEKSKTAMALTSRYLRDWIVKGPESQLLPESRVDDIIPLADEGDAAIGEEDSCAKQGLRILSKKTKRELILEVTMMRERMNKDMLEEESSLGNQHSGASNGMSSQMSGSKISSPTDGCDPFLSLNNSSRSWSIDKPRIGLLSENENSSVIIDA